MKVIILDKKNKVISSHYLELINRKTLTNNAIDFIQKNTTQDKESDDFIWDETHSGWVTSLEVYDYWNCILTDYQELYDRIDEIKETNDCDYVNDILEEEHEKWHFDHWCGEAHEILDKQFGLKKEYIDI